MSQEHVFLSDIRIQDFRAISNLWVPLREVTVLIGENNTGKTSFLEAIGVAMGNRGNLDDIRIRETGEQCPFFQIDVKIKPSRNQDEFDEVARAIFQDSIQIQGSEPEYVAIRITGSVDPRDGTLNLQRRFLRGWATDRQTAEKLGVLAKPSVSREVMDLIVFNFLDARRDIVEQLRSRTTFWGRMTRDLSIREEIRKDIERALVDLGTKITDNSITLQSIKTELESVQQTIVDSGTVTIEPIPIAVTELTRGMDILVRASSSPPIPIGRQGMGTRSVTALLVFRAFVNLSLAQQVEQVPHPVSAIEEPEAHLHPQGQRAIYLLLKSIPGQKIVSTHSPFVTSIGDIYDFRVFRRHLGDIIVSWVPATQSSGQPTFSPDESIMLRRFIQLKHGEVLFSKCVLVFEGDTEEAAMPVFADHRWGVGGADTKGVSFINAGGSGNFKHIILLLDRLRINWLCFADGDQGGRDGIRGLCASLDKTPDDLATCLLILPQEGRGQDFEQYIVSAGYRLEAEKAIADFFGDDALASFKAARHGRKRNNDELYDYESAGWEDRLVIDYLHDKKGKIGFYLAKQIVEKGLPERIETLFKRLEEVLQ